VRWDITRRAFLAGALGSAALPSRMRAAQTGATRLILLGTGGGPRPRTASSASAQVIVSGNAAYVVDCGDGVARQLVFAQVPLTAVRHVFVTHHHSDHNADLERVEQQSSRAVPSHRVFVVVIRAVLAVVTLLFVLTTDVYGKGQTPLRGDLQATQQASNDRVAVPEPTEQAKAYYRSGNVLWALNTLWALALPALLLWTGLSARMRNVARTLGRKWFFIVAIYWVLFTIVTTALDLPRIYYEQFVREHAYGLSNQTLGKWASDQLASLGVTLVFGVLFLWVPYLLLKKSPRRWWIYTSALAVPFIVLVFLIQPVWIDPLFNRFGPMQDKTLEAEILALADRAGIEGGRVFEVAKSEDTKALNAYVNGFGSSKRIVLWDTIIKALDRTQLLVVMGHEMGHYVLNHVWKLIAILAVTVFLTLYAVQRLSATLIHRFSERFGFTALDDVASLPLVLMLFAAVSVVTDPIALATQRHFEHEADRFALEITRANHAGATAFVIMQQENLAVPRPGRLYTWFRLSHPPVGARIDFFNDYRPWESGQPLVYGNRFR
jgi:Zn-dependent protease with chaperone function